MNPITQKLRAIIAAKESNLCVAADLTTCAEVLNLAEKIGDKICILKTHVDILTDFTPDLPTKLREIADRKNFLIFEDRKFADIGNTVKMQFQGGIYKIADWADIVNVHPITGWSAWFGLLFSERPVGVLFLAQMTPEQFKDTNFFDEDYAKKSFKLIEQAFGTAKVRTKNGKKANFPIGFIGSAEQPEILKKLRDGSFASTPEEKKLAKDFFIMVPGVKFKNDGDGLGQTYNTPEKAIENGADVIIVGRGIYQNSDPAAEAEKYRIAGWEAMQKK